MQVMAKAKHGGVGRDVGWGEGRGVEYSQGSVRHGSYRGGRGERIQFERHAEGGRVAEAYQKGDAKGL